MTETEFRHFFVEQTDLLAEATPEQRAYLLEQYLAYEFEPALSPDGTFSLK